MLLSLWFAYGESPPWNGIQQLGGDFNNYDYWIEKQNTKYQQSKLKKERTENEIIAKKLEINDLNTKKRQLEREALKQNSRHIDALEREILYGNKQLQKLTDRLKSIELEIQISNNVLAEILLLDSEPFFNIH